MKLRRKHIGGIFDVRGGDGSWAYVFVAMKGKQKLFYNLHGEYWVDDRDDDDWRRFKTKLNERHIEYGWKSARDMNEGLKR